MNDQKPTHETELVELPLSEDEMLGVLSARRGGLGFMRRVKKGAFFVTAGFNNRASSVQVGYFGEIAADEEPAMFYLAPIHHQLYAEDPSVFFFPLGAMQVHVHAVPWIIFRIYAKAPQAPQPEVIYGN